MEQETVSKYEHERTTAILERQVKRLFILVIVIFVALVGTNVGWIIYEAQFQDVVMTENSQSGEGTNIITGGDLQYGTEDKNSKN